MRRSPAMLFGDKHTTVVTGKLEGVLMLLHNQSDKVVSD